MSRYPRSVSPTGFYHIIFRGINKQIIFEDKNDYDYFFQILAECKQKFIFELNAYCLMDNHIHLLIGVEECNLSELMKYIAQSYARYFNCKYSRSGHLFQNRFKSEPVENDRHFLTVLRYIVQNPVKAGISSTSKYAWNCYDDYSFGSSLVNTSRAIEIAGSHYELMSFLDTLNNDSCMDCSSFRSFSDIDAISFIKSECNLFNPLDIQTMSLQERNDTLRHLKDCGLSTRQLERLTGISRSVVQRA